MGKNLEKIRADIMQAIKSDDNQLKKVAAACFIIDTLILRVGDEKDEDERGRVLKATSEILKICAEAGGTISGEHGIGIEKLEEMSFIFSESDLDFLRGIKHAFDPLNILNPGKILPEVPAAC